MHGPHGKEQSCVGLPYTYFMVLVFILHWVRGGGMEGAPKAFQLLEPLKVFIWPCT